MRIVYPNRHIKTVAICLLPLLVLSLFYIPFAYDNNPFMGTEWQQATEQKRKELADEYIRSEKLIGVHRDVIHKLLGRPNLDWRFRHEWGWFVQHLTPDDQHAYDKEYFIIEFNDEGFAAKCRLWISFR